MKRATQITVVALLSVLAVPVPGIADDLNAAKSPSGAVRIFPDAKPDAEWGINQFWPMTRAYGWKLDGLADGTYRIVVRVAAARSVQGKRTIAKEAAEREFVSGGTGLRIDEQTFLRGGFVAVQIIDLSDLGIEDPAPLRLRVTFTVNTRSGSDRISLPKDRIVIPGRYASHSARQNASWQGPELHLMSLWVVEQSIEVRNDILLVRDGDETPAAATKTDSINAALQEVHDLFAEQPQADFGTRP